jgi:hypothetical protein
MLQRATSLVFSLVLIFIEIMISFKIIVNGSEKNSAAVVERRFKSFYFCIYGSNTPPLEARVKFGFAKLFSKAS